MEVHSSTPSLCWSRLSRYCFTLDQKLLYMSMQTCQIPPPSLALQLDGCNQMGLSNGESREGQAYSYNNGIEYTTGSAAAQGCQGGWRAAYMSAVLGRHEDAAAEAGHQDAGMLGIPQQRALHGCQHDLRPARQQTPLGQLVRAGPL